MAKKSIIDKNLKLKSRIAKMKDKRSSAVLAVKKNEDPLSVFKAMKFLDKTSSSSYIKYRNRCMITGRPRSYRGSFGLCRNMLRHYASFGVLVGVKKMS